MMLASWTLAALLSSSLAAAWASGGAVEDKYSCPHGWTRYGTKKCLKYINELQDYERAQSTCRSKNQGSLVSIHSHEEQNFVYSYIHSIAASSTPVWLGAKQIDFESILWLDKTENSYTNWAPSEPSHPDEICIAINPRNGMWHDVMCTEANVPACERAPTTQWPFFVAFCSEGWFQFNDEKCVRIISSQALNFYESQELCRSKYNSKLLSIKTDRESEFLHNLIKFRDVKLPVWLGAVQNDFSSFNWIDKSDVTFTNWAEGEPNDPDHACLSMTASGGKWSDNDCKEQKLILCQKVPEDSSCETGWLQFRQDKCYRFVHIRLAFDDAESLCNNLYAGHLPSIHSQEEQFMISQFLASVNVKNGSEIWLGGRQMDFHNFNWGDGSLFNYSYWEHGEPNFPAEKCIEMSWRNGRWNDISCRLKRAVLCERQVTSRHSSTVLPLAPASTSKPLTFYNPNCLAGDKSANCSAAGSPVDGAQGGTSPAGAPGPLDQFDSSPQQAQAEQANSSALANSDAALANRSLVEGAGGSPDSSPTSGLMLPPDDQPIKMIASIIHREQPQPEQAYLPLSLTALGATSTSTLAPTTDSAVAAATSSTTAAAVEPPTTASGHSQPDLAPLPVRPAHQEPALAREPKPTVVVEQTGVEPRAAIMVPVAAAAAAANPTSLLMEKLRPPTQQQTQVADTSVEPASQSLAATNSLTTPPGQLQRQLSHPDISGGKLAATVAASAVSANPTTATLPEVPTKT